MRDGAAGEKWRRVIRVGGRMVVAGRGPGYAVSLYSHSCGASAAHGGRGDRRRREGGGWAPHARRDAARRRQASGGRNNAVWVCASAAFGVAVFAQAARRWQTSWQTHKGLLHTSASVARSGCAHRPERGQHREEAVGCRRLLRECARCVHARRRAARVARAGRFAWPSPAARAPQWDASTPRAPRGAARRGPFGGGWSRRLRRGGGAPCTAGR